MFSLGTCIYEDGVADGMKRGIAEGEERGKEQGIEALIMDNLDENVPENRIIEKLQKRFHLKPEDAERYYQKYAACEEIVEK